MDKQKHLQKLFNKPMDRKQFLAHIGAGALAIMGVSGVIKGLVDFGGGASRSQRVVGYGSSPYGGTKK
ncbi:MAG TPA: hypothetical protein VJC09_01565 [Candidatus Saccharimonadales bacterium]|nr:hypothetical protein [Candidatus Saccharimonadales bacterium]